MTALYLLHSSLLHFFGRCGNGGGRGFGREGIVRRGRGEVNEEKGDVLCG